MTLPYRHTLSRVALPLVSAALAWIPALSPISPLLLAVALAGAGLGGLRFIPRFERSMKTRAGRGAAGFLAGFLMLSSTMFAALMVRGSLPLGRTEVLAIVTFLAIALPLLSSYFRPVSEPVDEPGITEYAPLAALAAGLAVLAFINPLAQNNDGFLAKAIGFASGIPANSFDLRPTFALSQAAVALAAGTSPLATYAVFPLALFFLGVIVAWDLSRRSSRLPFLLLAAPVIGTEILITRPQVILLAYSLPLFCLAATARRSSTALISGAALSLALVPFHEPAAAYLLMFLGIAAVRTWDAAVVRRTIPIKTVLIGIAAIIPYVFLFHVPAILHQTLVTATYAARSGGSLAWRWWFLDSYVSVDGSQLGWPGLQVGLYYLYNGLPLYVAGILLLILAPRGKRLGTGVAPVAWFLAGFLFFAEIAPRFGFTFLLNRTWPYIALAAAFVVSRAHVRRSALASVSVVLAALLGFAGAVIVARDNVAQVFPEERGIIAYLRDETPANSLVLSTQPNGTLVELYADRRFWLGGPHQVADVPTANATIDEILGAENYSLRIRQVDSEEFVTEGGRVISHRTNQTIEKEKVPVEKPYVPDAVYYLFSKRKATGRVAERTSQYAGNASGTVKVTDLGPTVYEDEYSSLVRVR